MDLRLGLEGLGRQGVEELRAWLVDCLVCSNRIHVFVVL